MRTMVKEILIQKQDGVALPVYRGQILRIIEIAGEQVADLNIWNLHDFSERLSAGQTAWLNGSTRKILHVYSAPPHENVLFTVIADPVGVHWIPFGRCSAGTYAKRHNRPGHVSCQDILARVIGPYGLKPTDVHDALAIFMKVATYEDGRLEVQPPTSKRGDYYDMRAEMDTLVAVSACPNDFGATNNYGVRPLKLEIYEDRN